MAVTLPASLLRRYRRFSLYNSPFTAHDTGAAIDLYPGDTTHPDPEDGESVVAPSPVAGEVVDVRRVSGPSRPYAADHDHLVLVDTGAAPTIDVPLETDHSQAPIARLLHVDPTVDVGDAVAVGDPVGHLRRTGFFAPWVANHLHLGFRTPGANQYRATGSHTIAVTPSLHVEPVAWDGTGTVVATGDTYAVLDSPAHPDPGETFAGVAVTDQSGAIAGVLDGGLPHYDGGGLLRSAPSSDTRDAGGGDSRTLFLAGDRIGRATGRDVTWADLTVFANGDPIRGLALAPGRDRLGIKLVGDGVDLPVGTEVTVSISDPDSAET